MVVESKEIRSSPTGKGECSVIVSNKAKCLKCLQVVESKSRHDFRYCGCEQLAVDGGKDYVRRLFGEEGYEELIEEIEDLPL